MMRKLLLAGAALLQFAVIAPAVAAPCTMQTLASYILLGATGCTVDGVDFGDFSEVMLLSGATQIDSTAVTLTPLSDATGTGFSISSAAPIVAGAGELFELYFGFNATSAPGRAFTSNTITLDASAIATGDGAITIVEDKCLNGMFTSPSSGCSPPTSAVTQIVFAIDIDRDLTETAMFAPANFFDVFIDLVVDGVERERPVTPWS